MTASMKIDEAIDRIFRAAADAVKAVLREQAKTSAREMLDRLAANVAQLTDATPAPRKQGRRHCSKCGSTKHDSRKHVDRPAKK